LDEEYKQLVGSLQPLTLFRADWSTALRVLKADTRLPSSEEV
jgi:hypothetical protein